MKSKILIIACMCISTGAVAGGYRVALQGQNALGMGHTGVAMTESAETVFFNPAGMAFLDSDINIVAGATLIDGVTKYQNEAVNVSAETDNPIGTPIGFYISKKLDKVSSYGLGIYTPYGNAVEWEKDWAGSFLVNNIDLKAVYIQPTVSLQINDKLSVGFGPTYVNGSIEFNRNLSSSPSLADSNGDRANVTVSASGVDAWGYNFGLLAKPNDKLSIGISYRSQVNLKARDESADFENIPDSMSAGFADTTFDADLVLPAELTLGISYALGSMTTLAFDLNRTYWSAYKSLDLEFKNSVPTSINPRNYNDANVYRFGVQHKLTSDFTLRGGVYFDQSPISDGYYTPETARNDSIGYTAGASYSVSKSLALDFSFLYLSFEEFSGAYDPDPPGTTTPFAGDYKSSVIAAGLGINYKY